MWEFSNLNSGSTFWPPDSLQQQNTIVYPTSDPDATKAKKFLVFDHSRDRTNLFSNSIANPNPPASNATHACDSSDRDSGEEDEMHEDTEEIDALLYSDSGHIYDDDEEDSTGHSPLDLGEAYIARSYLPSKRRRSDSTDDTASSTARQEDGCNGEGDTTGARGKNKHDKRENIRATVSVLRSIIPGGKGKDAAAVLDEAIQYLKLLKLQVKAAGANSSIM